MNLEIALSKITGTWTLYMPGSNFPIMGGFPSKQAAENHVREQNKKIREGNR